VTQETNDPRDSRAWVVIISIIAICFLAGIGVLVLAVWLDWT
jgi:hypothetical protein